MKLKELHMFLTEASNAQDTWERYYKTKISFERYQKFAAIDPTSNFDQSGALKKAGKYTKWILKMVLEKKLQDTDIEQVKESLTLFNTYKSAMEIKDINQFATPSELEEAVSRFVDNDQQVVTGKKLEKQIKNDQADKIYEASEGIIVVPKTEPAACFYGRGTKWCTAATKTKNYFNTYNSRGPLFIYILDNGNKKFQLHLPGGELRNSEDESVNIDTVFDNASEEFKKWSSKAILDYFKKTLKLENFEGYKRENAHSASGQYDNVFDAVKAAIDSGELIMEQSDAHALNYIIEIVSGDSFYEIYDAKAPDDFVYDSYRKMKETELKEKFQKELNEAIEKVDAGTFDEVEVYEELMERYEAVKENPTDYDKLIMFIEGEDELKEHFFPSINGIYSSCLESEITSTMYEKGKTIAERYLIEANFEITEEEGEEKVYISRGVVVNELDEKYNSGKYEDALKLVIKSQYGDEDEEDSVYVDRRDVDYYGFNSMLDRVTNDYYPVKGMDITYIFDSIVEDL